MKYLPETHYSYVTAIKSGALNYFSEEKEQEYTLEDCKTKYKVKKSNIALIEESLNKAIKLSSQRNVSNKIRIVGSRHFISS